MSRTGKKTVKSTNADGRGINIPPQSTIPNMPPVKMPKKNT